MRGGTFSYLKRVFLFLLVWDESSARLQSIAGQIQNGGFLESDIMVTKESLISLSFGCHNSAHGYATAFLRRKSDLFIIMSVSAQCAADETNMKYVKNRIFSSDTEDILYDIIIFGDDKTVFNADVQISQVRLTMNQTSELVIRPGVVSIHTFKLPEVSPTSNKDFAHVYRYVNVRVESDNADIVGKLIATPSKSQLYKFLSSPNASSPDGIRLSFSTFGNIVLSDVSRPALSRDTWIVGIVLFNDSATKRVNITIEYNADYEYVSKIVILLFVSLFGFILPVFSRYIFNYLNADREVSFEAWLTVVKNWFYRGPKGLSYLTGFLAWMLLVSAFQVVHAKWSEMITNGDRDVCYYNEKCYRPYLGYYDVSVNGIASNMCFMVHGAILILSVSMCETSCYSLKHKNYDYSIAYSFGMAFIFEGFGSLLYHICPSQIIFQFDTLFMFVISQYIIAALVDGHAARHDQAHYKLGDGARKSIRIPKMFLFFLGPAYGFNFLGSLHYIDPLPKTIAAVFYVSLAAWVTIIMIWAAYKASILPKHIFAPARITIFDKRKKNQKQRRSKTVTIIGFLAYAVIVLVGYIMVCTRHLVISIFILGELIVAVLIMTAAAFVSLVKDLWNTINGGQKFSKKMRCLIPSGVVLYLTCGLAVAGVSLFFFTILEVTNKSIDPWKSRELNHDCILNDFYDSHDLWHFFASHALMMIVLVVVQMSKPCRDCYKKYKSYDTIVEQYEGRETATDKIQKKFHQEPEILKIIPLT